MDKNHTTGPFFTPSVPRLPLIICIRLNTVRQWNSNHPCLKQQDISTTRMYFYFYFISFDFLTFLRSPQDRWQNLAGFMHHHKMLYAMEKKKVSDDEWNVEKKLPQVNVNMNRVFLLYVLCSCQRPEKCGMQPNQRKPACGVEETTGIYLKIRKNVKKIRNDVNTEQDKKRLKRRLKKGWICTPIKHSPLLPPPKKKWMEWDKQSKSSSSFGDSD